MELVPLIELDMADYGGKEGEKVVLGVPGARTKRDLKNKVGRETRNDQENLNVGDAELEYMFAHIKKAPFAKSIDAFLNYCDNLPDEGSKLYDRLLEAVEELDQESISPSRA